MCFAEAAAATPLTTEAAASGRRQPTASLAAAWLGRMVLGAGVAWLILAGVVLGRYADEAVPTAYLVRPLIVVALLSLIVGAVAAMTGQWSAAVAAAIGVGLLAFEAGYLASSVLLVSAVAARLLGRRGRRWPDGLAWRRLALTLSAAFFLLAAVRAGAHLDPPSAGVGTLDARPGPSIYLVLLDGYPRADTLGHDLGIDNTPFLAELAERGFDVYDDARSARHYTELTLASMLNASEAGVPAESGTVDDRRLSRRRLDSARLPALAMDAGHEHIVIDSPVGHVTYTAGRHVRHGGVTDFEAQLLAQSTLGRFLAAASPQLLTWSLRGHLENSLSSLVELTASDQGRVVLAHLMAPHLPALYAADGSGLPAPPYWPDHQLFGSVVEEVGITLDAYRDVYPGHLQTVNQKVLDTLDAMLARDPEAVIVLFSDHGARFSFEAPDEWTRSFLAARTPGHPGLFGDSPTTTQILCDLFAAYLDLPCQ